MNKIKTCGMRTLSSHTEIFIFKGHSKHELIKFHCSAIKKICKYYYLHLRLEELRMRESHQPSEARKEIGEMASMGFVGCGWSALVSSFFLCQLDVTS